MDVDTVLPVMMLEAGGTPLHVGLITAIMLGGPTFAQLFFSPILNNQPKKKNFLLSGIAVRTISLFGMGILYSKLQLLDSEWTILIIFILLSAFSFSGAFAAISYTDILGKSLLDHKRKSFFSIKQSVTNVGFFFSAYLVGEILSRVAYPDNYSWLFFIAGISLSIASLGFFRIREVVVGIKRIAGVKSFIYAIREEVQSNKRLKYYVLMVNTLGVSLSILPFIMMYVKQQNDAEQGIVADFLLLKVSAAVVTGTLLFWLSRRIRYNQLLYFTGILGVTIVLLFVGDVFSFYYGMFFLIGGILITTYKVATDGVLLEISSNHNRSLYAGIAGIANLIPAFFPIIGGLIYQFFDFKMLFYAIGTIQVLAVFFIYRLDCQK
jgi:MFS family permease